MGRNDHHRNSSGQTVSNKPYAVLSLRDLMQCMMNRALPVKTGTELEAFPPP